MMHMHHAGAEDWCHAQGVGSDPPPLREGGERAGQLMAEAAKGINPQIAPEEVKEEVKEATAEMVDTLRPARKRRAWYYWTS